MIRWLNERVYVVSECLAGLIYAFFVVGVGGTLSVLLDLDHVVALLFKGIPITWQNLATRAGRPFHVPVLILSGLVLLYSYARFHRLQGRSGEVTRKIVKVR